MDTLALLCNLYGDGPQTLRRLREAGCGTLAALETIESERLASLLRTSVRSAKRFKSEGRLLRERSEPSAERVAVRTVEATVESQPPADQLVANVLSAWREHDSRANEPAPPRESARVPPSPEAPLPRRGSLADLGGVDGDTLQRLARSGIVSPEQMAQADVLDLAGRGVGGYTRLLHLQFLARRAAAERASEAALATKREAPSALLAPSDVLVPVRPPERRGAPQAPSAPSVAATTERFSPSAAPGAGPESPLEGDLRHFATREAQGATPSREGASREDAGSSGPFA